MHEAGLIHGNLSPENWCMGAGSFEDILYLIDFKFCTSLNEKKISKFNKVPEAFSRVFKKLNNLNSQKSKMNAISLKSEGNIKKTGFNFETK